MIQKTLWWIILDTIYRVLDKLKREQFVQEAIEYQVNAYIV